MGGEKTLATRANTSKLQYANQEHKSPFKTEKTL